MTIKDIKTNRINKAANSTYPKVAVQWLNQALCFYQILCLADSEVLRNRHLQVAAKRCVPCKRTILYMLSERRNRKSQRTFGTFASSNTQANASACKRANFLPTLTRTTEI